MSNVGLRRYFYSDRVGAFLARDEDSILGLLARNNTFALDATQRDAWLAQIQMLKSTLAELGGRGSCRAASGPPPHTGHLYFEYSIPRLGKRVDVILLLGPVVFVIEFKVGESTFPPHAIEQVWDYALDLKNFHETSHHCTIAPILVATDAPDTISTHPRPDGPDRVLSPIACSPSRSADVLSSVLDRTAAISGAAGSASANSHSPRSGGRTGEGGGPFPQPSSPAPPASHRQAHGLPSVGTPIDAHTWESGRYAPTPTIIEAATALYNGHSVSEISRSDASAINLTHTTNAIESAIHIARDQRRKVICFVNGVPGAGKTLVGLYVATRHTNKDEDLYSVFLSGNGPLVAILREALARDRVRHERELGRRVTKSSALSEVKAFIQNVHHFRDECLIDSQRPPIEHVAIFDEAQRAWNREQTSSFMRRKKKVSGFDQSEPEYLISCLNRHPDWAVVICLVGGGQEINTGEAGIGEWIDSVLGAFPDWHLLISSRLLDSEYAAGKALSKVRKHPHVEFRDELHLSVSMRSFRAENVSLFVKLLLDQEIDRARDVYQQLSDRYPIVLTRDLTAAKNWLRHQARGSERYGIVDSSEAQRLKPHAIDVRTDVDPIHWFLDGKEDVRSSFYLEDVATEFQVQGLELDWTCVTWDADFRRTDSGWDYWSFCGDRWNRIRKPERQTYLKNAYRVLLTRARQGMVIVVPEGVENDPTRAESFYDPTFAYLQQHGIAQI